MRQCCGFGDFLLSADSFFFFHLAFLSCLTFYWQCSATGGKTPPGSEISEWNERVLNSSTQQGEQALPGEEWPRSSRPRRRISTNPESLFFGAQEAPEKHPSLETWLSMAERGKPLRTCPMCCSKCAARPQRAIRTIKATSTDTAA